MEQQSKIGEELLEADNLQQGGLLPVEQLQESGIAASDVKKLKSASVCDAKQSGIASNNRSDAALLLIATHKSNKREPEQTRDYYNFYTDAFGKFPKPVYHKWDYDGYCTSKGWVIYDNLHDKTIRLENPFLSSGNQVIIPGFDDEEDRLCKACLSACPSLNPNDFMLVANVTNKKVGYYTRTTAAWKFLEGEQFRIHDIIYAQDLFYWISSEGAVYSLDLNGSDPRVLEVFPPIEIGFNKKFMFHIHTISPTSTKGRVIYYIVQSSGGLLGVRRIWGWEGYEYYKEDFSVDETPSMTLGFQVFRWDEKNWVETDTLNGQSLFLGGNTSLSRLATDIPRLATDIPRCKPNCIYYTSFSYDGRKLPHYDMGYYCLADKSTEQFYYGDDYAMIYPLRNPPPMWLEQTIVQGKPGSSRKRKACS